MRRMPIASTCIHHALGTDGRLDRWKLRVTDRVRRRVVWAGEFHESVCFLFRTGKSCKPRESALEGLRDEKLGQTNRENDMVSCGMRSWKQLISPPLDFPAQLVGCDLPTFR